MTASLDRAVAAAEIHHDELRDRLTQRTQALIAAVATRTSHTRAQRALVDFLHAELVSHFDVEETLLYTAGDTDATALLVRAMQDEHRMLVALVHEIERGTDPLELVIAAGALVVLCDVRIQQENRHLLPALAAAGVDLSGLLQEAPEIVGDAPRRAS